MVTELITHANAKLDEFGFRNRPFLNVLVEQKPGAIRSNHPVYSSFVERFPIPDVELPGLFGRYGRFIPPKDHAGRPTATLVLRYLSRLVHIVAKPFAVVHEIAHVSAPEDSPRSPLWREARADVLSFLITGIDELKIPQPLASRWNGLSEATEYVMRSLSAPTIRYRSELKSEDNAYHQNSQVISALLFRMARLFGANTALGLIHFIDAQSKFAVADFHFTDGWRPALNDLFDLAAAGTRDPIVKAWIATERGRFEEN